MLPESISQLTTEKNNDIFYPRNDVENVDFEKIIANLKRQLTLTQSKKLEEGVTFYKTSTNSSHFIKNILTLYTATCIQMIKMSDVPDDEKRDIINIYDHAQKTYASLTDMVFASTVAKIKKHEKIIDIESISSIILGYATETLRRAHNSKNNENHRDNVKE